MTQPVRILAAAVGITLIGVLPALGGPRIKPRIPAVAQSTASVLSSSSSSGHRDFKQESSASREFKDGLVSGISFPADDGAAKSADGLSSSSWSSMSHPH